MNKILQFGKGVLGVFLFFAVQIGFQLLFYKILIKDNLVINNILFIVMDLILMGILFLMNRKKLKEDYSDFNQNYKKYLKYGFKMWFIGIIVMIISNAIIANILGNIANNESLNREMMQKYPFYMLISTMILAPFMEELTFRGNFKDAFKSKTVFIIFTAFLFAGVHVFNGITSPLELLYFIPYGSLAIALGKIYMQTDNIYTSMVIHSVHNSLSIILLIMTV